MRAERRHELKENELLHTLNRAREYVRENAKPLGITAVIVVAVVAAVVFGVRSRAAAIEDVWRRRGQLKFDNVEVGRESLASLAAMTRGVSDKRFVLSSLIEQGQQGLRLAAEAAAAPDPDLNKQAGVAFRELLDRYQDNPLAAGVARLGLTTVEENEFAWDGDVAHKARADEYLAAVINDPAMNNMPFVRVAMDRRKKLDQTFTRVLFSSPETEEPVETKAAPGRPFDEAEPADQVEPVNQAEPVESDESDEVSDSSRQTRTADEPTPSGGGGRVEDGGTP